MKLRIKGNSIRFRLQRREIEHLQEAGRVSESLTFGPAPADQFTYALALSELNIVRIGVTDNTLTVCIPSDWANDLANTERVGFEAKVTTAPDTLVCILVEKDFKCLVERADEDEGDVYTNPHAGACGPGKG